ncbi:hypothetical protein [Magnetospira sp. QH-2]|uniref:hypothetical protein n=1 Tax=Magnetospira sp. (strain QH-2) TaxID=1288970 RepID=UPI0003E80D04|nr:hypothetical protein [Magnetospira sp. QH-2]CCQ72329.1 protein of unknown function [Magnetospira sp. QH-2]
MTHSLPLRGTVGRGYAVDLTDALASKLMFKALGYYRTPDYGLTPYADEQLSEALEWFQRDHDLFCDGRMDPDGSTARALATRMQDLGRNGDTLLIHVNPQEARLLHQITDGATVNPHTGLLEFADDSWTNENLMDEPDSGGDRPDGDAFGWDDSDPVDYGHDSPPDPGPNGSKSGGIDDDRVDGGGVDARGTYIDGLFGGKVYGEYTHEGWKSFDKIDQEMKNSMARNRKAAEERDRQVRAKMLEEEEEKKAKEEAARRADREKILSEEERRQRQAEREARPASAEPWFGRMLGLNRTAEEISRQMAGLSTGDWRKSYTKLGRRSPNAPRVQGPTLAHRAAARANARLRETKAKNAGTGLLAQTYAPYAPAQKEPSIFDPDRPALAPAQTLGKATQAAKPTGTSVFDPNWNGVYRDPKAPTSPSPTGLTPTRANAARLDATRPTGPLPSPTRDPILDEPAIIDPAALDGLVGALGQILGGPPEAPGVRVAENRVKRSDSHKSIVDLHTGESLSVSSKPGNNPGLGTRISESPGAALDALKSSARLTVDRIESLVFQPEGPLPEELIVSTGIFYDLIEAGGRLAGYTVAADNLAHFRAGTGEPRWIDSDWLRSKKSIEEAELENRYSVLASARKDLQSRLGDLPDGGRLGVGGSRVTIIDAEKHKGQNDLFYASNLSNLRSEGRFTAHRQGNRVSLSGWVNHGWSDRYDWHNNKMATILGVDVPDYLGNVLRDHRGAKEFDMLSHWQQTVTIHATIMSDGTLEWDDDQPDWQDLD